MYNKKIHSNNVLKKTKNVTYKTIYNSTVKQKENYV